MEFNGSYLTARIIIVLVMFGDVSRGVVSVQGYCNSFNYYGLLQPLICFLTVNTTTTTTTTPSPPTHPPKPPHPPPAWEWESEEDDCSCDIDCLPLFDVNDVLVTNTTSNSTTNTTSNFQCQPCGTTCSVDTSVSPRCRCAALGPSSSTTGAQCRCSVTCATNPWEPDDPFCIFDVSQITLVRDPSRVYSCECDKTLPAQNNPYPDFACTCQPNL